MHREQVLLAVQALDWAGWLDPKARTAGLRALAEAQAPVEVVLKIYHEELPRPNAYHFTAAAKALRAAGRWQKAVALFAELPKPTPVARAEAVQAWGGRSWERALEAAGAQAEVTP